MQWFVALKGTKPIGVVAASSEAAGRSEERHVESMWVAPSCRGLGIARRLLTALTDIARAQGLRTIMLWVLDGNDVARSAYLRLGFTFTGERQPLPSSEDRIEERMKRELS
jgi:ribosomal protein S18 acetylase RimI-like enzyme